MRQNGNPRPNKIKMQKAIFLDRDGIINYPIIKHNKPFAPLEINEVKIIPNIHEVIKYFKMLKFKIFVITNQPDFVRGKTSKEKINKINIFLKDKLDIDEIYVCYHDNDDDCQCRKPKPGAFFYFQSKYSLDLSKSVMVGDRKSDIWAAKNAGCLSIFVDYDYNESKPNIQTKTIFGINELKNSLKELLE